MKQRLIVWILSVWLGLGTGLPRAQADPPAGQSNPPSPAELASVADLKPGPNDGRIASLTAQLLQFHHYSHQRFDREVSSRFLDRYIKDLDPQHLHFLQTDLDQFEGYRYRLNDLILVRGDTYPGYVIFSLFLQRLEQRLDYSIDLLKHEQFDFKGEDRIVLNRKDLPFPKTLDEARKLWRERVRFDYLAEKLNQPVPEEIAKLIQDRLTQKPAPEILAGIRASQAWKQAESARTNAPAETAETRPPNDITLALKGKMSEDRADKIAGWVAELLPKAKPEQVAATIQARLERENGEQVVETLSRRYSRTLKLFKEWDGENVLEVFLNSLAHVYDPHSDYLGKSALENFAIGMNHSLFGIGAELISEDGYCKIRRLLPGPAQKSKKIKPNDKIVAVAQADQPPVDIVDMPLYKAVDLIRGPKNTEVRLTIVPADASDQSTRKIVSLMRDEIKLEDQEAKAKIIEVPAPGGSSQRLGVIDLPAFYSTMDLGVSRGKSTPVSTTDDVAKLLKKLEAENVSGVILDLRRNGGGSLEEAIRLTGLFIKSGPVVQVRDPDGTVNVDEDRDPQVTYDGPLVVLTSRFSASASEIVAGALQDYRRALLVGDSSTHGKGTVQSLSSLKEFLARTGMVGTNNPGALKLTIRKFYRPSGQTTQLRGVIPDIVLPSVNNVADVGERALDNPLGDDTIPSANFEKQDRVEPYVAELRKRSAERVAKDKDYEYIHQDMDLYKKAQAEKVISLNEQQRRKEKEEADARRKARDKELLARKEPDQKIYEITLKTADQPGLPAPLTRTNAPALAKAGGWSSATGTNSASVSPAALDPETDLEDEKAPVVDALLDECEHILADYLTLLPKRPIVTANTPTSAPAAN